MAYNPSDYIKDYSWISDVGKIAAGVVSAIPEARAYSKKLKEDQNEKYGFEAGVSKWVDDVLVDKAGRLDPAQRTSILTSMGYTAEEIANPDALSNKIKNELILKPKETETSTEYVKRAMPLLGVVFEAAKGSGDPDAVGWLTRASVSLQGATGQETPAEVKESIEMLNKAKDYRAMLTTARTPKKSEPLTDEQKENADYGVMLNSAGLLPETDADLLDAGGSPMMIEKGLAKKILEENKATNLPKRASAFNGLVQKNPNGAAIYRDGPVRANYLATWLAGGGSAKEFEDIYQNNTKEQGEMALKLLTLKQEAAQKADAIKIARENATLESLNKSIAENNDKIITKRTAITNLLKDGKKAEAKAEEEKVALLEQTGIIYDSEKARLTEAPDPGEIGVGRAFYEMRKLLVEPDNDKALTEIQKMIKTNPLLRGLEAAKSGSGRGISIKPTGTDNVWIFDTDDISGKTLDQVKAALDVSKDNIERWFKQKVSGSYGGSMLSGGGATSPAAPYAGFTKMPKILPPGESSSLTGATPAAAPAASIFGANPGLGSSIPGRM